MSSSERLIHYLIATIHCASCQASFVESNLRVVAQRDALWFVAVQCHACETQGLVAVIMREAPQIEPSAADPEAAPQADSTPISEADVAAMRALLDGYQGDLQGLLRAS
jgi:hypothetical protein